MKRMILMAALAVIVASPVLAFHDGGVADCQGCHTMHNSQNGVGVNSDGVSDPPVGLAPGYGYNQLLLYPNASDVCLACHGGARSYNVYTDDPLDPGLSNYYSAGNFVFLNEDNINDGHNGGSNPLAGEHSGHNIMSGIKGSNWDTVLDAPPSDGTSPLNNNEISCSSCHDPHGNSSFRLLYRGGQQVGIGPSGGEDFVTYGATVEAFGISFGAIEANDNHNTYVSGYSQWCSTCHTGFHNNYGTRFIHPSGTALGGVANYYNSYNGTVDCVNNPPVGGNPCGTNDITVSYLADVPFEEDGRTAGDNTSRVGPSASARVACMTCHRAHATSARDAGRWDFQVSLLIEDGDESGSWPIPNSYSAQPAQRSLCNKCHTKDEFDTLSP
jgi:hypothetical protein